MRIAPTSHPKCEGGIQMIPQTQEISLNPIIGKLESYFSKLNHEFYNGELKEPIISISPNTTRGKAYGWCTSWRAWADKEEKNIVDETLENGGYYEINICAEHLSRPFIDVIETLLHEMVHLYNLQNGIYDTSRNGTYHNKYYKRAAESHGLIVEKDKTYGFCKTALNNLAFEYVSKLADTDFVLYRRKNPTKAGKQSSRKYICPKCGAIVRATKTVKLQCIDCQCELIAQ